MYLDTGIPISLFQEFLLHSLRIPAILPKKTPTSHQYQEAGKKIGKHTSRRMQWSNGHEEHQHSEPSRHQRNRRKRFPWSRHVWSSSSSALVALVHVCKIIRDESPINTDVNEHRDAASSAIALRMQRSPEEHVQGG